jgi:hypothetical protein
MGARHRDNDLPRLEARVGISSLPMGHGLQGGDHPLRARSWIADLSHRSERLQRLDRNFPMEESLRHRIPVRRTTIHPPDVPPVDLLPRHLRRLQQKSGDRLF